MRGTDEIVRSSQPEGSSQRQSQSTNLVPEIGVLKALLDWTPILLAEPNVR